MFCHTMACYDRTKTSNLFEVINNIEHRLIYSDYFANNISCIELGIIPSSEVDYLESN